MWGVLAKNTYMTRSHLSFLAFLARLLRVIRGEVRRRSSPSLMKVIQDLRPRKQAAWLFLRLELFHNPGTTFSDVFTGTTPEMWVSGWGRSYQGDGQTHPFASKARLTVLKLLTWPFRIFLNFLKRGLHYLGVESYEKTDYSADTLGRVSRIIPSQVLGRSTISTTSLDSFHVISNFIEVEGLTKNRKDRPFRGAQKAH